MSYIGNNATVICLKDGGRIHAFGIIGGIVLPYHIFTAIFVECLSRVNHNVHSMVVDYCFSILRETREKFPWPSAYSRGGTSWDFVVLKMQDFVQGNRDEDPKERIREVVRFIEELYAERLADPVVVHNFPVKKGSIAA